MTRPHSQISSMIKLYRQASASADKVDHERWQRKRISVREGAKRVAGHHFRGVASRPVPPP
jgi:hypothetical protein